MTAGKLFMIRSAAALSVLIAVAAFGLIAAGSASAAELHQDSARSALGEPVTPQEGPVDPGEGAGGVDEGPVAPEGEGAAAEGGSVPIVAIGIGVLLLLALVAAYWASRKPGGDIDPAATQNDHRYIPPGV